MKSPQIPIDSPWTPHENHRIFVADPWDPGRVLAELESLERSLRMTPRQLDFPQLQQQVEDGDVREDDVMVHMLYMCIYTYVIYIYMCVIYYVITINYCFCHYYFHYLSLPVVPHKAVAEVSE